jgi:probable aminopeptidase NPEPL1
LIKWYNESIEYLSKKKSKSDDGNEKSTGSSVSWLNKFIIQTLSNKFSRNNTPSRANLITKLVRQNTFGEKQTIVIACEKTNGIACASAVARTFPIYSRKTTKNDPNKLRNVQVLFMFTDNSEISYPSQEEVDCFSTLAKSIRLAAKIVDTPCAEMTTNHFLEVQIFNVCFLFSFIFML